ncbi:type III effector protein [Streptomyces sp. NPDC006530]|uniref:type III effector protein n=1 Tax=Streptomyces sp. NPDC006530 TaxID=3364750 RepID=UPI00369702CE
MPAADQPSPARTDAQSPASFFAAAAALEAIEGELRAAQHEPAGARDALTDGPEQALACLLLLRQIREELSGWETGLIESAREAGASWAELAQPLGVASRQAAERRYLRNRPGPDGSTGEQRVQATRERRAADRTTAAWARDNAAALRRIASQISTLGDLAPASRGPLTRLDAALGDNDPTALVDPLGAARPHLTNTHPDLAARLDALLNSRGSRGASASKRSR